MHKFLLSVFVILGSPLFAWAQVKIPAALAEQRMKTVKIVGGTAYAVTMASLSVLWYADKPSRAFHILDDGRAWLWMDKCGHAYASYQTARLLQKSLLWAGMRPKKSAFWAAGSAFLAITSIEIFDGFSQDWGASPSDALANLGGSLFFLGQQLRWQEERIYFRWSYTRSGYAKYRPKALGNNTLQRWLKDYNGQVYWLSASPKAFFKQIKFPAWLGLAVGYGAEGIIGAYKNPYQIDGKKIPNFQRNKQFYVSLDVFPDKIKSKSKFLRTLLFVSGAVKFPLPALRYTQNRGWDWFLPLFF